MKRSETVLVDRCRQGDRDAFAEIVTEYQSIVCAVTYGKTGNLSLSEELAQETFITAWQSIQDLRDPDRLRQWLCGIARNLAKNALRRRQRDPLRKADSSEIAELADGSTDPQTDSIHREDVNLLDRTLASMPDSYREPLVLFYREQQSVARVAELLDLSPGTVKQRLSRGRQMLRKEVAAVVERGLLNSAPGRAFTIGVLAALPVMSGSAKAATITVTTAKGVEAMQAASWMGLTGAILGPLVGIAGAWFGYSNSIKSARSDRERDFIRKMMVGMLVCLAVMTVFICIGIAYAPKLAQQNPKLLASGVVAFVVADILGILSLVAFTNRRVAQIRREDGTDKWSSEQTTALGSPASRPITYPLDYQSTWRFLGLPLVSIRFHGVDGIGALRDLEPAKGWIAIGDKAYGVLFAAGSVAVGGVACGALGIGVLSMGGMAIGGCAMGGAALGYAALGGAAVGWYALGGLAIAWQAALGGMAIAKHLALGGVAIAQEANTELAQAYFENSAFTQLAKSTEQPWIWWVMVAFILSAVSLPQRWLANRRNAPHNESRP